MTQATLLENTGKRPDMSLEKQAGGIVCGIDEAGRGPIAGPVVAAAVVLPGDAGLPEELFQGINDSKKLTAPRRVDLSCQLQDAVPFGIGITDVREIDRLNIHHATLLAMQRAMDNMIRAFGIMPGLALVDGKFVPELACRARAVVGGDGKSLSIAAASIIAKVHRDGIMTSLAQEFVHYGWDRNAGYPTREHKEALEIHGVTPHHRTSYAPVRALCSSNKQLEESAIDS